MHDAEGIFASRQVFEKDVCPTLLGRHGGMFQWLFEEAAGIVVQRHQDLPGAAVDIVDADREIGGLRVVRQREQECKVWFHGVEGKLKRPTVQTRDRRRWV